MDDEDRHIRLLQLSFRLCHVASRFQDPKVQKDFQNGEKGAILLTSTEIKKVEEFSKLLCLELPRDRTKHPECFQQLATHHTYLAEGKDLEIIGTSYQSLKELLVRILDSDYFSTAPPSEMVSKNDNDIQDIVLLHESMDMFKVDEIYYKEFYIYVKSKNTYLLKKLLRKEALSHPECKIIFNLTESFKAKSKIE